MRKSISTALTIKPRCFLGQSYLQLVKIKGATVEFKATDPVVIEHELDSIQLNKLPYTAVAD